MNHLNIAEVSDLTGLTARAIRYYEERGLVRPERDCSGARSFDPVSRRRLLAIAALRRAGLTLEDIARVLGDDPSGDQMDGKMAVTKLRAQADSLKCVLKAIERALAALEAPAGHGGAGAWRTITEGMLRLEKPLTRASPFEREYGVRRGAGPRQTQR